MIKTPPPLISVIVPVWNPGPGISRCIESLQNQSLREIEMIFVDDCGTDSAMDFVRAAAAKDTRIRILENDINLGAGASRNRGIEAARGKYLSFIDPDDYVSLDFLELLYKEAVSHSLDIVKGSKIRENVDGSNAQTDRGLNQLIHKGLEQGKPLYTLFTYEHQSAVYRRDYILSHHIRYGLSSRAQDSTFLLMVCSQTESFALVDGAYYHFCARKDSAMNTMTPEKLTGFLQAVEEQTDYVLKTLPVDNASLAFLTKLFHGALREYERYRRVPEMELNADNYLSQLRDILRGIPHCEVLVKRSASLQILKDYGIGLPTTPYFSPWEGNNPPIRYAELTGRWIDYYLNHPSEANACQRTMLQVCRNAYQAVQGKPSTLYSDEERQKGKDILQKQISRLPLLVRLWVKGMHEKKKEKRRNAE